MVGVEGFEPPTSCSQSRRATRLRYTPSLSLFPQARSRRKGRRWYEARSFASIRSRRGGPAIPRAPTSDRLKQKGCRSTLRVANGAPGEIRTPDHQVRSLVLYPTELRARCNRFRRRWTAAEYSTPQSAGTSTGKRAIILIAVARVNLFLQQTCDGDFRGATSCIAVAHVDGSIAVIARSGARTKDWRNRRSFVALRGRDGGIARLFLSLTPARCALRGQPLAVRIRSRRIRRTGVSFGAAGSSTFSLRHIRKTPTSVSDWQASWRRDCSAHPEPRPCALRAPGPAFGCPNSFPTNSSNGRLLRRRPFLALFSLRHIRKTPH